MKKILCLVAVLFTLQQCSVKSTARIDNSSKFTYHTSYIKDNKTGLCFGIVGIRRNTSMFLSGIGYTCVPCEKVEKYLVKSPMRKEW